MAIPENRQELNHETIAKILFWTIGMALLGVLTVFAPYFAVGFAAIFTLTYGLYSIIRLSLGSDLGERMPYISDKSKKLENEIHTREKIFNVLMFVAFAASIAAIFLAPPLAIGIAGGLLAHYLLNHAPHIYDCRATILELEENAVLQVRELAKQPLSLSTLNNDSNAEPLTPPVTKRIYQKPETHKTTASSSTTPKLGRVSQD